MPKKVKASSKKSTPASTELKLKLKKRTAELKRTREQQAAVSDILRVIAEYPADVTPVLETIAEHARRLCQSSDARVWLVEGNSLKYVAGCVIGSGHLLSC